MNGVLIVDKPSGPTSFDVVRKLRGLGKGRKAGHTGTLDPMASGLLPICLGDATRIAGFILEGDKGYEGVIQLGQDTDTWDATGKVVAESDASGLDADRVRAAVEAMQGEYWQTPPMYSAVRVGGKRLYELARQGEEIERRPRKVHLYSIEMVEYDTAAHRVTIRVQCSKGTYIRAIAYELGEALGVGAHLMGLRRLASGPFSLEKALPLEKILSWMAEGRKEEIEARVISMADALSDMPTLRLDEERSRKVAYGKILGGRDLASGGWQSGGEESRVRILAPDGRLLAVAEERDGGLRYLRVFVTPADLVDRVEATAEAPNGR